MKQLKLHSHLDLTKRLVHLHSNYGGGCDAHYAGFVKVWNEGWAVIVLIVVVDWMDGEKEEGYVSRCKVSNFFFS